MPRRPVSRFASDELAWRRVIETCKRAGLVGFDTETFGHDVETSTTPWRAKVHVWSLAVLTSSLHPRGFQRAKGVVLPVHALDCRVVRDFLEDSNVRKVAHNAPHDVHAVGNHGINVRGWVDSLPRARMVFPDAGKFGLKSLCKLVGRELTPYEKVLTMDVDVPFAARRCPCGVDKCSRRSKGHGKADVTVLRRLPRLQPLETVVPGHPLWEGLVSYAEEDAVTALELWGLMDKKDSGRPPDPGWSPEWKMTTKTLSTTF